MKQSNARCVQACQIRAMKCRCIEVYSCFHPSSTLCAVCRCSLVLASSWLALITLHLEDLSSLPVESGHVYSKQESNTTRRIEIQGKQSFAFPSVMLQCFSNLLIAFSKSHTRQEIADAKCKERALPSPRTSLETHRKQWICQVLTVCVESVAICYHFLPFVACNPVISSDIWKDCKEMKTVTLCMHLHHICSNPGPLTALVRLPPCV